MTKILSLTDGAPAVGTDVVPVARTGANRRLTLSNLITLFFASPSITTPSISSPTITGTVTASQVVGIETVLARSGIPFIHLSSGSVAANGAISAITALPNAYASAYCFFPANALATSIAAGWYYCTFSTTTAGTAFLNTYTSGVPTIPGSPTAVTDGKGAFTGDTSERLGPSITLPAGAMGPNGCLKSIHRITCNNTAGSKRSRTRVGGVAGTQHSVTDIANSAAATVFCSIRNRGVQTRQVGGNSATTATGFGISTSAQSYGTDTLSSASTIDITLIKGAATDNIVLEDWEHLISYGA